ncbi:hypothetical protein KHC17_00955 [Agrobacterium salinitolerans]|jgi:hypothetical protein|uniref:Uncharacterized protein n=1 Tax=Agrobacterium salinitolerans TaxID=1183413 RepID=A0A4Z1QM27_9HYPH|nr:hypothetical protein [Agrobacterium salinitolerans]QXC48734.1 hypothetical protein KHC17_00955 [Agrobacterium salinitolerans]UYZ10619.1 hypothetical protein CFBP5507_23675 [Agrobacterium salinitolerans]
MTNAVSLLSIRRVLNEFCEENCLPIGCSTAVDAAKYLMRIASTEAVPGSMLRSALDQWMAERVPVAA